MLKDEKYLKTKQTFRVPETYKLKLKESLGAKERK